jgi:uncharacterized protein YbjQ (UPF0145 family)
MSEVSMEVSFSGVLADGRPHHAIGRVKAVGRWRAAVEPHLEADRAAVLSALMREAEDYGAEALTEVSFEIEEAPGADIDRVGRRRVVAIGSAVRFALAA